MNFKIACSAMIVAIFLAGCGGTQKSIAVPGSVTSTGGFSPLVAGTTNSYSSSVNAQTIQVTLPDGSTGTAIVPAGSGSITTSTKLAFLPSGIPILNGFNPGVFKRRAGGQVLTSYDGKNFTDTGLSLGAGASLSSNIAMPSPSAGSKIITVRLMGPFLIGGDSGSTHGLTINDYFQFSFLLLSDGTCTLPTGISMQLPPNGGMTALGNHVDLLMGSNYQSGKGVLFLAWPGVTKSETKTATAGLIHFVDSLADSSDYIPASGISNVVVSLIQQ